MPSKEQKLEVALANLMDNLPYRERAGLPYFIEQMTNEGVDWWLEWTIGAIKRKRAQDALAYRLQQTESLRHFVPHAIQRFLNQFNPEGIDTWLAETQKEQYPMAVVRQPDDNALESPKEPTELFHDLFREIVWIHQYISPILAGMDGIQPMAENLATVAYGQHLMDDVGIHKGTLYVPRNGSYVHQETELFCPFNYTQVEVGVILTDYDESFAVLAFHPQGESNSHISPSSQLSLITTQDAELKNLQQLRMQFYDESKCPCPFTDCTTISGELTTLVDGELMGEESFLLRQHLHKPLFYREVR